MREVQVFGHLGELIQGRHGSEGPVALITLPSPCLRMSLSYASGAFEVKQPQGQAITPAQLERLFAQFGRVPSGHWRLLAEMPIGAGGGASTAALLAFCRALSPAISPGHFARIALALEGASDPLAHPSPERLLWASREGRVLAELPPLPKMLVVGGFDGPGHRTDPLDMNIPDIADLVARWPKACADPAQIGALVSESSRRSMELRGKPGFPELASLGERHKAHGLAIAHTGSARGFLLAADRDPRPLLTDLASLGWTHLHSYLIGETHA